MIKYGDLATENPELAKEWHPTLNGTLLPSDVTVKSGKIVWWLGKCGHEWQAKVCYRNNGTSCPYCSNQKVLAGYNDLLTTRPLLANEWDYDKNTITPKDITRGSNKIVW